MYTEECQICKKELKGAFYWVKCEFWTFHPVSECGGCVYPVGIGCIKKVPKEFIVRKTSLNEWIDEQERRNAERDGEVE